MRRAGRTRALASSVAAARWHHRAMPLTVAASKPMHAAHRIAFDGAVDADGHILEPPSLWEEYIDPHFRDRALRVVVDEHGLEELEIDGRRSRMTRRGFPATLGAMGHPTWPTCRRTRRGPI